MTTFSEVTDMDCARIDEVIAAGRVISHPYVNGGEAIPLISTNCFCNTLEGWNLMAECHKNGDMTPYFEARAAYDETHDTRLDPRLLALIRKTPTVKEAYKNKTALSVTSTESGQGINEMFNKKDTSIIEAKGGSCQAWTR